MNILIHNVGESLADMQCAVLLQGGVLGKEEVFIPNRDVVDRVIQSIRAELLEMFEWDKLKKTPEEWGFYNETDREIRCLGYATNLSAETIEKAGKAEVDFLLTHHDSWEFLFGLKDSCNKKLETYHITHAFFHAPLDDADFGTSSSLAAAIQIRKYSV